MENNNDLLERIRRSQQPVIIEEGTETSAEDILEKEEQKELSENNAVAINPIITIILLVTGTILLSTIFKGLQYAEILDLNSWHGYLTVFIQILYVTYIKNGLVKWRLKRGTTGLSKLALILCNIALLMWWGAIIIDGYKDLFG